MPEAHVGMMVTPSVRLVRPLGEGGMGAVWVADHQALRTEVVVKFIASELKDSKEATERFSREAAAAAQVKSPHVVQTFDHGVTTEGIPYIVMELLEGEDLGKYLDRQERMPLDLAVLIVAQLARALDRAHEKGIVHRDIKPGNIFLCYQGKESEGGTREVFVKLLDFGIAKGVEIPKIDSNTKTGAMIGSPFYMSPEQILGSRGIDHRSDLWSVGVVAYEALTGKKPFDAETMGGLAIKIHSEPLPLPSRMVPELPPSVDAWFQRACARNIEERYNSAKELAEELAKAVGGEMPKSLESPRISTGSSDVSQRVPSLIAGAATDAGVVRSTTEAGRRRSTALRIAAAIGILVAGVGAFATAKWLKSTPDPQGIALTSTIAPDHSTLAGSLGSPATNAIPPPPPPSISATTIASAQPPPPTTKAGGHVVLRPRPKDSGNTSAVTPLPSQAPPPTTVSPPPVNSRDIF